MISAPSQQPQIDVHRRKVDIQYYPERLEKEFPLEMMLIPSGTFMMGSPEDELERLKFEGPQHKVTVPSFFMSKHPVTQEQWRAVAKLPQINRRLELEPSHFKGDHNPVEQISWYEAVEYCDRLAKHTNRSYRLPSEAEWEYACRAGTSTPFHFGEIISTDYANYCGVNRIIGGTRFGDPQYLGTYGNSPVGKHLNKTIPTDYFTNTNDFGLCNMHGNIWEWCLDSWHNSYIGAPTEGTVRQDPTSLFGQEKVIRGGSWDDGPFFCRSAFRQSSERDTRHIGLGFRVVVSSFSEKSLSRIQ